MNYDYIIWDWNGTLLDDVSAAMDSVNDMLVKRGMEKIDIIRYKECIGVPIIRFYEEIFDLEKEDYNEILREYNVGYLKHLTECDLSEGAREMLEYFKNLGCRQVIVSSSHNGQLLENTEKYGIKDYFEEILGSEDFLAASKIERAIDYLEKHPKGKVLVIGDIAHDCEMAEKLGADCVLLTSGHEMFERLKECNAKIIDSLLELK